MQFDQFGQKHNAHRIGKNQTPKNKKDDNEKSETVAICGCLQAKSCFMLGLGLNLSKELFKGV
jgi:hypothetical protein